VFLAKDVLSAKDVLLAKDVLAKKLAEPRANTNFSLNYLFVPLYVSYLWVKICYKLLGIWTKTKLNYNKSVGKTNFKVTKS